MFTELTAKVRLCKYIDGEGVTHSSEPFKQFTSKELDYSTAADFKDYLDNLASNQTIIYGQLNNKAGPRSLSNIKGIKDPWIAFDGDYIITNPDLKDKEGKPVGSITLNLNLLYSLDPQLANCMYVERHSSSNLIIDGKPKNSHKKKIWFKFKTSDQDEIRDYIDILFTRAITLHYGQYVMSESKKSFQIYLRTIFDKVVFSPERIWNEASPKIDAPHISHNTYSTSKEGNMVDPTALHPLTDQEKSVYQQLISNLRHNISPLVDKRKAEIEEKYPALYRQMLDAESHILSSYLIASDGEEYDVVTIINDYLSHGAKYEMGFKDPLDPEYGDNKAKLFYNTDGSIVLHSFAHGSQTYHLLIRIKDFYELDITDSIPEAKDKPSRKLRFKGIDIVEKVIPYLYIDKTSALEVIIEELKCLSSKPSIKRLFEQAATKKTISLKDNDLMARYSLYRRKDAPWVSFDKEEGLTFLSREGMNAIMDNKEQGIAGSELTKQYLTSKERKEVDGFGMYVNAPTGKLNMWAGFNAHNLNYKVTEEDIAPYMEIVSLMASTQAEKDIFLDWRADLLQRPLRAGGRPGYAVKGDKGTGKSFEQNLIADLFHPFNVQRVHSMDQIVGKHNAELAHTVLIVAEEMNMGNTSYAGSKDTMKALLFSPTYRVEPKGIDSLMVPNHIHLMLSTNHAEAVIQDSDDRRWSIFEISTARMRDKKFFKRIQDWWDNGGKNMVFTYFLQREYNLSAAQEGTLTNSGKEERIQGFYGLDSWVYFLLNTMGEELKNNSQGLYNDYCAWFEENYKGKNPPTLNKFGLELNKQGIIKKFNNERILNKEEGRLAFERKFFEGIKHHWDDTPPDEGLEQVDIGE